MKTAGDMLPSGQTLRVARDSDPLKEVLDQMVDAGYSQLPVIDVNGTLQGQVTFDSILRILRTLGKLDGIVVKVAMDRAQSVPRAASILQVLDAAEQTSTVVVVEKDEPIGILTSYDFVRFYAASSLEHFHVRTIEVALREIVSVVQVEVPEDQFNRLVSAVVTSGERKVVRKFLSSAGLTSSQIGKLFESSTRGDDSVFPLDRLSLGQLIDVLFEDKIWLRVNESVPSDRQSLKNQLRSCADLRNKIAHHRGELSERDRDLLKIVYKSIGILRDSVLKKEMEHAKDAAKDRSKKPSTYAPLEEWLRKMHDREQVLVSFQAVEQIIGRPLPGAARSKGSWWANVKKTRVQSRAWLSAGFRVDAVNYDKGIVTFARLS